MRLLFDLETNGLLDEVTTVHCCVAKDIDTGEVYQFRPGEDVVMLNLLSQASLLIAHNGIRYDLPVLKKLYDWEPKGLARDTIVLTKLIYPNLKDLDFGYVKTHPEFPKNLIGRHSLEAWGHRLGVHKAGYKGGWEEFSQEMLDYCVQDIEVTHALWKKIESKNYSEEAIQNEHDFTKIMFLQERHGFAFDLAAAHKLHATLGQRRLEIERQLQASIPGWYEDMKVPAYWTVTVGGDETRAVNKTDAIEAAWKAFKSSGLKRRDLVAVPGPLKQKHTPFNPGSRDHIARLLTEKYGWKPTAFTDGGKPQIDESVLEGMVFEEAKALSEYFMLEKRLGQLAEGDNAWLKLEKKGRIHGEVNSMGAVTSRCSHSKPNMAQVTACDKPFGKESRALFTADPGQVLVGIDASGIQLRALAHYLYRFDGGAYVQAVTTGDVHTTNQKAAGLPTRDNAKTFIYAWLLGAGDRKIGEIIGQGAKAGKALKERFLKNLPAFKGLKDRLAQRVKADGSIIGLDGRIMPVATAHFALASLLQGFEAVVMKKATWLLHTELVSRGYVHGVDFGHSAMVHDEWQLSARKEIADEVGKVSADSITKAGEYFKSNCPLAGEFRIGANWKETH